MPPFFVRRRFFSGLFCAGVSKDATNRGRRRRGERSVAETDREKLVRKRAIQRLEKLAEAKVNDAVKLAFLERGEQVDGLDLTALTEFRRSEKGGVEIRLVDRTAILRELAVLGSEKGEAQAEAFFRALEEKT